MNQFQNNNDTTGNLLYEYSREYHCFHAKLNAEAGLVDLHVGSPVPNVEHACLKPSFDIDVPFLLATLMPVVKDGARGSKM